MSDLRDAVAQAVHDAAEQTGLRTDMVMGEYLVIAAANGWDEEGREVSQVIIIPEDGSESRILGLLTYARVRLERDVLGDDA